MQRYAHQSPESLREGVNVLDEPQPQQVSTRGDVERSCKSNNSLKLWIISGEPAGTRTQGPRLKRAMLYRLSYRLTEKKARILPPTLSLCLAGC